MTRGDIVPLGSKVRGYGLVYPFFGSCGGDLTSVKVWWNRSSCLGFLIGNLISWDTSVSRDPNGGCFVGREKTRPARLGAVMPTQQGGSSCPYLCQRRRSSLAIDAMDYCLAVQAGP